MEAAKRKTFWLVWIASAILLSLPAFASSVDVSLLKTRAELSAENGQNGIEPSTFRPANHVEIYDSFWGTASDSSVAPRGTVGQLDEAFHYTARQWGDVIKREGLRPGSYATPNGNLSGLGAKLELALPPTRSAPDIRIRIDLEGLRKAGYEIPTPTRVSNVVRGPDGRVYTMPGGGYEMQFPYEIPGEFLEVLPLR